MACVCVRHGGVGRGAALRGPCGGILQLYLEEWDGRVRGGRGTGGGGAGGGRWAHGVCERCVLRAAHWGRGEIADGEARAM